MIAFVLWALCGLYAAQFITRGWIPHDEGTIGQTAERVLAGQVPHHDFDDMYTGGLTYLNAAAMKMLGVNLRAPRIVLFVFFMVFLASVYSIGRRTSSPTGSLVAMAMATVWSVPNYFVSLPSWYNLFFATFGVLAFLRHLETRQRRWLVAAGLCGGLSVLAKISGVFFIAGGVLFLVYLEQCEAIESRLPGEHSRLSWLIVAAPVTVFLILLGVALLKRDASGGALGLFLPAMVICVFLLWREGTIPAGSLLKRAAAVWTLQWPFIAGAALPVLGYAAWFASQDALSDLVRGVFVLPQRRLAEASVNPHPLLALALGLPCYLLLVTGLRRVLSREGPLAVIVTALLGALLALAVYPVAFRTIWAVAFAMPIAVVSAAVLMAVRSRVAARAASETRVFLVVTTAAMVSLIQFPYATPIYFCYAAPMVMLAFTAVVYAQPAAPKRVHLAVAAFFFAFAAVFVNQSYAWNVGVRFLPYHPDSRLELPRGGLTISAADKQTYEELVRVLQAHASGGTIYAGPDCPEVYFLSGFANRTRAIFDFLTPQPLDASAMSALLADPSIRAAVINTHPLFSPALDASLLQLLEQRFPSSQHVGRFVVRF